MANEDEYVTRYELIKTQNDLKNDVTERIDNVHKKVDTLNDIVLPLVESSKQTAKNTDRMATVLDEFTTDQRKRNGEFYDRLHDHDRAIDNLGLKTKYRTEDKKQMAKIIVAGIGLVAAIVSGIFGLAPLLFN